MLKEKKQKRDTVDFRSRTFYSRVKPGKNIIRKLEPKPRLNTIFKRSVLQTQYNYSKLHSYSNRNLFMTEIKDYIDNKKRINLNKLNKFHHMYIHNKINSFSDLQDNNEFTSNDKTTEITSKNVSNHIKPSILKRISLLHYKSESTKTRNRNIINFNINTPTKTDSILSNLTKSVISNGFPKYKLTNYETHKNLTNIRDKIINKKNENFENNSKNKDNISFQLNEITKPLNYKFNDIIGNMNNSLYCQGKLTSSRGMRNGLTEQIISKMRYSVINKIKKEFYKTQTEIQETPLYILKKYEFLQTKNKKYYLIFEDIIKKYFRYINTQIDDEKYQLFLLKEQRESLKEQIVQIHKKIKKQNDKLNFFQNFMKLLIKIKYNTFSLNTIPENEIMKYGVKIALPNSPNRDKKKKTLILITNVRENSRDFSKRKKTINLTINKKLNHSQKKKRYDTKLDFQHCFSNSMKKSDNFLKKSFRIRNKSKNYVVEQKIPIFKTADELFIRLKDIEGYLQDLYKEYSDKKYVIHFLEEEKNKEKSKEKTDIKIVHNNEEIEILEKKLKKIKEQNIALMSLRDFLNSKKGDNHIEYKYNNTNDINDNNNENEGEGKEMKIEINEVTDKKKKKINFSDKLISILLKFDINIEELIECQDIYRFLKSPKEIKIKSQEEMYMKTLFCVKVLEMIYFKLMEKREEYLSNIKTKEKYLKYEEEVDRNNNLKKSREKREREINQRLKRDKEILIRTNKIPIILKKRYDPFSKNIYHGRFKKFEKGKLKKMKKHEEYDFIFNNYIKY